MCNNGSDKLDLRKPEIIISEIKELINKKGYIYALCMILFEDFHIAVEELHKTDYSKRISTKEASFLLGFLIKNKINFSIPDSPQSLIHLKEKTYELMEELHHSFMIPFMEKLHKSLEEGQKSGDRRKEQKEFFGKGNMLTEPIFYSGTGVYDFQYLEFLDRKYKYDINWLKENKDFEIDQAKEIVSQIKKVLQEKSQKVRLFHLKETLPQKIDELKKNYPNDDLEKHIKELQPIMELYQYLDLFFEYVNEEELNNFNLREAGLKSFYKGLIELFTIRKSDLENIDGVDSFFANFSISLQEDINSQFQGVGNFNIINARPIINLDNERYFIPITFLLYEAVYENPFYWMWLEDKPYRDQLSDHRGKVGEEITYSFLEKIFGKNRTFKSLKVTTKKGQDDTDIDVLCILGSKALCVQVKSKKLTELSRTGNDDQLHKDFKAAVQDAFDQGLISREKILNGNSKFYDGGGNEIKLSEEIDEVYLMCITTENYPSLTHQSHIMLDKLEEEPFPIVLTIFDLELVSYYLNDPFDFLYYIKQRTSLMDYFNADEEIVFLGYHLDQKLWKIPNTDFVSIESDFGQIIDRNYYPIKAGLEISDDGDAIKNKWQNEHFTLLCNELKNIDSPKITDIVFQLYDLSGKARETLVNFIISTKQKTINDGKLHNFSMPPDDSFTKRSGITYLSFDSDNEENLKKRLLSICQLRKYHCKADAWIGFGSYKNSLNMIDVVLFNDQKWGYDSALEKLANDLLGGKNNGTMINLNYKLGRNDKCFCGSGKKYKYCCGK